MRYFLVLLNMGEVVNTCANYSVVFVLADPIESEDSITPKSLLGDGDDSVLDALPDVIEADDGVAGADFDAGLAFNDFAALDFASVALVNANTHAEYSVDLRAKTYLASTLALEVDSHQLAVLDLAVCKKEFRPLLASVRISLYSN
jgi:hypothetical protein